MDVSDGGDILKWTGRPKGSTDNKKREDSTKLFKCINSITVTYSTEKSKLPPKKRLPNGFLRDLIQSKKKEYGVNVAINKDRIISRHRRGNLCPNHRGTDSPIASADMALVEICIQMGKIRQPLTGPQAVVVFNDLIRGTPIQESLRSFQSARCPDPTVDGVAGINWFRGFKKDTLIRLLQKGVSGLR